MHAALEHEAAGRGATVAEIVRFDDFEVDLGSHLVSRRGARVRLRDQSLTVLRALLERPGRVVTREELRRRLWPDEVYVDFDNILNTAVARLRDALGDSAERPRYIETLPRHGYRFIAPVQEVTPPDSTLARRPRLLVLPFLNTSGDAGQDYFASAMTDEILTELASFAPDGLAVIARTTSFHYKDTRKDLAAIARELNLDYVIEGGARRDAGNAMLNVQLIRVADQAHVWASRYEARLGDLHRVERAVADAVGAALGVAPGLGAAARPRRPTEDLEAHTLYRQGRHSTLMQTPESFAEARRCFEQAVERDPQFALAHSALAELWWYFDFMGFAPPKTVAGIGMAHAMRALEIDNSLAEAHALLGHFRWLFDYDWPAVRRHVDRARELNPSSPMVRLWYAMGPLLAPECRLGEAIDELRRAVESDPRSVLVRAWLAIMFHLNRDCGRAAEESRLIIDLEPGNYVGYWLLGAAAGGQGRFDEAIAACRRSVDLSGGSMLMLGWLGLALGHAGRAGEAREVLARLQAAADRQAYVPPTSFAWTYLGLGEVDDAFAWLDRAVEAGDRMMVPIQTYWFFDPLRGDARFADLLRRMKLAPRGACASS
jgi:TolB-like protein/Tfp pilus assembly protein PilF